MQGSGWIGLFKQIPSNLHDALALGLSTGIEIVVQQLLRLDDDFMVLRGRTSGSNDGGRIMILPYGHLVSIAFNRRMMATEVEEIFGPSQFAAPHKAEHEDGDEPLPEQAVEPTVADKPHDKKTPLPDGANGAKKPGDPQKISRSILLARLRERLQQGK
jgi:hypothetical protein